MLPDDPLQNYLTKILSLIKDIINKGFPDEKYNCKYMNNTGSFYEYVHKTGQEIEAVTNSDVGFKTEPSLPFGSDNYLK